MENKKTSDNSDKQKDKNNKNEGAESRMAESRHEKPQNQNWDQAQRRNQAGPRGYGDSTGIMKGERENGMERMEEKDPKNQKDQKDQKDREDKNKS
jgi:hypothetical protein